MRSEKEISERIERLQSWKENLSERVPKYLESKEDWTALENLAHCLAATENRLSELIWVLGQD